MPHFWLIQALKEQANKPKNIFQQGKIKKGSISLLILNILFYTSTGGLHLVFNGFDLEGLYTLETI